MTHTRRQALVTLAAAVTASNAAGQSSFLSADDTASLKALVDTIIPRTETPGASDEGVHLDIDRRLAADAKLSETFRAGLSAFETESQSRFHATVGALTSQQRIELLTSVQQSPFFRLLKDMTIDGYYTSKEGLAQELGWHGNSYLREFKGCTHPEHQS